MSAPLSYDPSTWFDGSGGGTPRSAARFNHMDAGIKAQSDRLDARAVSPLEYGAVGNGTVDDTSALLATIDAAPEGSTIWLSGRSIFKCTSTLTVDKRLTLAGPGALNFTAGVTNAAGVLVTADGCTVDGVRILNPNKLGSQTGVKNSAIRIQANDVVVTRSYVKDWQHGIEVTPDGEWQNFLFAHNRIKDVQGAGDGASDLDSEFGEDRADGITVWGSLATIVGNIINAAPGTDARIGIHCEGLPTFHGSTPAHSDAMCTIAGNVVSGPFRRGITVEEMANVAITGNSVADSTWWAIALIIARDCVVSGNTIAWTRTAADLQGEWWAPLRGPFAVTRDSRNCSIVGNQVRAAATSQANAFFMAKAESTNVPTDIRVQGNGFDIDAGADVEFGVVSEAATLRMRVLDNTIRGFNGRGVFGYNAEDIEVRGNSIDGLTTPSGSFGIHLSEDGGGPVSIIGNTVRHVTTGIERANGVGGVIAQNVVRDCARGIDGFGSGDTLVAQNSVTVSGSEKIVNVSNGVDGNIVAQNVTL